MPRDYKPRSGTRDRRRSTPGWVWLLAGLTLGLLAAFIVYLSDTRAPERPVAAKIELPPESAELTETPVVDSGDTRPAVQKEAAKAPDQAGKSEAAPAKPRFDFYTILPEMEVVIPEQEITGEVKAGVAQVEEPGTYFLQAGSFRAFEQADRLKAQMALLGLTSSIETVTINNKETWHRVRVGPYKNLDELNRTRALLQEHKISAVLLKQKN